MNKTLFTRTLLAAAVFSTFNPALAADDVADTELETVNVVGSINKLQGVPFRQAKSAVNISAQTLADEGVEKMDEIGRYQAGFNNQTFGSDTNTNWFRVRGALASQSFNGAPAASYGFFTPHVDTFGVEAVEVTKGADSLTYGAAEAGGLINYISKRPDAKRVGHGEVKAHLGNNNQRGIAADYTGSFDSHQPLRYRLVGSYKRADGDWNGTYNESYYFAPSFAFDFSDRTHLTVLSSIQKDVGTPSSNFLPQSGSLVATPKGKIDPHSNLGDPTQDSETNIAKSIGYEFSHDFNNGLTFSQNYRYEHIKNEHNGAYVYPSAYSSTWAPIPFNDANGYIVGRGVVFNNGTAESHSVDNRLTWHFKNDTVDNTLIGGVDYRHLKTDGTYTLFGSTASADVFNPEATYGSTQTNPNTASGIKASQLGFYLQNQAKLFNKVAVTAGVRHDRARNEEVSNNRQSQKVNHTSYSGSVMYFAPFGLNPYVSYSESFRLPTGLSGNAKLYDPNTTKQYEVGVKYMPSWLDGSISVAAFRARDKGALQYSTTGSVSSTEPIVRKGVEVQADANITDNFSTQFAYTYLSSVSSETKTRQHYVPKHTASLRGTYRFDQGVLNGLALGAGVRYVGESVTQAGSLYSGAKVPSATVFDLFARYNFARNWTAQINADNISNRTYLAACDYNCYYGQKRSVVGSVSYKF